MAVLPHAAFAPPSRNTATTRSVPSLPRALPVRVPVDAPRLSQEAAADNGTFTAWTDHCPECGRETVGCLVCHLCGRPRLEWWTPKDGAS